MQTELATEAWEALAALPTWQGVLLVAGCSLLLAALIRVGGDALVRRVTRRIPGEVDDVVLASVHTPLYATVLLVGAYAGVDLLDVVPEAWTAELRAGALTLVTVTWVSALARMGRRVSDEATRDERFDEQVVPIFQNVWTAFLLGAGVFLVLSFWDVDVTPLLASAGVLGIVLGFAARDTIANFFGSIALYADRTYAVGDYVVLESGERGRVEDVSIRSTDVRTRDDVLVTVPNAALNTATIVNESNPDSERRVRVSLDVAYGSDLDHVEAVLLDVAAAADLVLEEPRPRVRVRALGDSAVELDLLVWIAGPTLRGRARHSLLKAVHARFSAEGIEVPFPQRVVTVAGDAPDARVESPVDPPAEPSADAPGE